MLSKLLSSAQDAFVEERQILDSILIVSEYVDHKMKVGIPEVLCNLDIEKAYEYTIMLIGGFWFIFWKGLVSIRSRETGSISKCLLLDSLFLLIEALGFFW